MAAPPGERDVERGDLVLERHRLTAHDDADPVLVGVVGEPGEHPQRWLVEPLGVVDQEQGPIIEPVGDVPPGRLGRQLFDQAPQARQGVVPLQEPPSGPPYRPPGSRLHRIEQLTGIRPAGRKDHRDRRVPAEDLGGQALEPAGGVRHRSIVGSPFAWTSS